MIWNTCLVLSVVAMVLCLLLPFLQNKFHFLKEEQKNLWIFCFFAGTSIAGIFLFFPAYMVLFTGDQFQVLQSLLLSLHNTIRLFIVDGEFTFLRDYLVNLSKPLYNAYTVWGILIFVAAPVLTFSFVLSFFRNVAEMWRYRMGYCQDAYVFSELNVRSLALATDLKKKDKKCVIVFTDFFEINEEA